ncbi:MAG TPA: hypothetical protein VNI77_06695 [Nitrososphaera sp.]|nr:hypothetical protein [Nitrososphaera sp.]
MRDLENVFVNRIDLVSTNLQIIASSASMQNSQFERAKVLFDTIENATNGLTNSYMWLDHESKMVWPSNISQTAFQEFGRTYRSHRPCFVESTSKHERYYSRQ